MPLPIDSLTFNGPCYLTYGRNSRYSTASFTMNNLNNDGTTKTYKLNSETFTEVEGVCFGVTITYPPEGGKSTFYPVKGIARFGPNAWGILQINLIPGIGIGTVIIDLAMTQDGQNASVDFINPIQQSAGDATSTLSSTNEIAICDGSVNNGVSDASIVGMTYIIDVIPMPPIRSPLVPTGKEIGPVFAGIIFSFQVQIRFDESPAQVWYPV